MAALLVHQAKKNRQRSSPYEWSSYGVERAQTVEKQKEISCLNLTLYPPINYCFLEARSLWSTQSQANRTNEQQSRNDTINQ